MPKDESELIIPAVEGTRRAVGSAIAAGVKRIVLTSSIASVAYGDTQPHGRPFTGDDWSGLNGKNVTPYTKSKTMAEKLAWQLVNDAGKPEMLSVVNPGFILGPLLDDDAGTSGDVVRKMFSGQYPGSPDVYFTIVDVRDVAMLHVKAIDNPKSFGKRLLIGSKSHSLGEIADILADEFPKYAKKTAHKTFTQSGCASGRSV